MEIVWFLQKTIIMGILAPNPFYIVNNDLVQLVGFSITASFALGKHQKILHIVPGENRDAG